MTQPLLDLALHDRCEAKPIFCQTVIKPAPINSLNFKLSPMNCVCHCICIKCVFLYILEFFRWCKEGDAEGEEPDRCPKEQDEANSESWQPTFGEYATFTMKIHQKQHNGSDKIYNFRLDGFIPVIHTAISGVAIDKLLLKILSKQLKCAAMLNDIQILFIHFNTLIFRIIRISKVAFLSRDFLSCLLSIATPKDKTRKIFALQNQLLFLHMETNLL